MKNDVAAAFAAFPPQARAGLLALREQIFAVASETPGVGRVSEELRWGQPAYLTPETKSGSTVRLGVPKTGGFALYVHCRTRLIHDFCAMAGPTWQVEGTRAVLFADKDQTSDPAIRDLIRNALTYHRHPARSTG
ncbi:DUF1801 domain-containing protein [Falsiphaeobacter marinintestinus]|uniref:DUF1801 domain-containing protein n=1 Tax=Falsiphaeobacter marinintestinus TaxID=1492905 RepID=UPI0011B725BB|nr:DUF1801 domain-containing protein [Phaeobacter marinintestinus]